VNPRYTLTLHADLLAAAAPLALSAEAATVEDIDTGRRTITGLVVPYGVGGRTNLGRGVAVRAGAVQFREPHRRVIGAYGHTGLPGLPRPAWPEGQAVARMEAYEDGPDALRMRFRVARTPLGDTLLAEAQDGIRSSLSIELADVQLDPWTGDIVSGLCEFVAFVPLGAYDDAQATSVAASLHQHPEGDDVPRRLTRSRFGRNFVTVGGGGQPGQPAPAVVTGQPVQQAPAPQGQPAQQGQPVQQAPAQQGQPVQQAPAQQLQAAPAGPPAGIDWAGLAAYAQAQGLLQQAPAQQLQAAPAGPPAGQPLPAAPVFSASPASVLPTPGVPAPASGGQRPRGFVRRMAQLQAQAIQQGGMTAALQAALADITPNSGGLSLFDAPAGSIGEELWSGETAYTRRYTTLMRPLDLTSWTGTGWEWVVRPKVEAYAGNKAQIASGPVSVQPKTWEAQRAAAGWDVDRTAAF
jgi:hypothetical protein